LLKNFQLPTYRVLFHLAQRRRRFQLPAFDFFSQVRAVFFKLSMRSTAPR
jgi:hypothetical protein